MSIRDYGRKYDRLFVALVTPYKEGSYEVDEAAMRDLLRYFMQPKFLDAGGAIVANPEASEVYYLTREEKRRNVEIAVEECGGKVPVFTGIVALTTEEAVATAIEAKEAGANGIFFIPPIGALDITGSWDSIRYPEVWIDWVKAIDEAVDLPIIAHPVASVSPQYGIGLPVETTIRLCREIPNFVGWKMTYNYDGYRKVSRGLRSLDRHVGIFGAPAVYFHENLAAGQFDGTVTGSFSYAMEPMIDHIEAWRNKDIDEARRIWGSGLSELQEYVYSEYSRLHIRYKIAAWLRGLIPHPYMRPPLPKPRTEEISQLKELLRVTGVTIIEQDKIEKIMNELDRSVQKVGL